MHPRGIELALKPCDKVIRIDVVTRAACFVAGAQSTRDEFSLSPSAFDASPNRQFDKLRKGLAITEDSLNLGAKLRFDAN
jgi:hypothetical protein